MQLVDQISVQINTHGLEPYAYLREVFTKLPLATTVDDIEALLQGDIDAQQINPR